MRVHIETTSGLERRVTVGVPAERVESRVNTRLREVARKARLDGFRPGKVPLKIIRERYGAEVRQEVLEKVMGQSFQEAVAQKNIRLAGRPSIEAKRTDEGRDLEFVATFEVFPDVKLAKMAGFKVARPQAEITDEDIDRMIDVFRKDNGTWRAVERPAAEGDRVRLDYRGLRKGEPVEGATAEGAHLVLGSGQTIPGMEDGIIGMGAGGSKTLKLTFPADYHAAELRGAKVRFEISLHEVAEREPAPLDADLFAKYGVAEGGEPQFRKEIRDNMQRELDKAVRARLKGQVLDALLSAHKKLGIPKALINQEIDVMRQRLLAQLPDAALEKIDVESMLPAENFRDQAERRVRLGLLLNEVIAKHKLVADAGRVRAAVEAIAETYEQPEQVAQWYYGSRERMQGVESQVLEDMVVDALLESAAITDEPCSYQQAIELAQNTTRGE